MGHFQRHETNTEAQIHPDPAITHHLLEMMRDKAYLQSAEARKHFEAYHMVGGTKRFGLVVDPGAASGLGGTDTKVEYDEHQVPHCEECDIVPNMDHSVALMESHSKA